MSQPATPEPRVFVEVETCNFQAQPGSKRYPPGTKLYKLQPWRLNLTALSSNFNLYFVVSKHKILVFEPKDIRNTILGEPGLIIDLPKSRKSHFVPGVISHDRPHAVNHLKVGLLGNLEILLIACDDGDVLAYYTHSINHEVHSLKDKNRVKPVEPLRPLLHENVGISAWGLAIHSKSRLIAISSNFQQVTIFAFACNDEPRAGEESNDPGVSLGIIFEEGSQFWRPVPRGSWYEDRCISNFTYILDVPSGNQNIPSIDFLSDRDGFARDIVAADTAGTVYKVGMVVQGRTEALRSLDGASTGWGVVSIPRNMIKNVNLPHLALGVRKLENSWNLQPGFMPPDHCFDISHTVSEAGKHREANSVSTTLSGPSSVLDDDISDDEVPCLTEFYVKALEKYKSGLLALLRPDNLTTLNDDKWLESSLSLFLSNPALSDPIVSTQIDKINLEVESLRRDIIDVLPIIQRLVHSSPEFRDIILDNVGNWEVLKAWHLKGRDWKEFDALHAHQLDTTLFSAAAEPLLICYDFHALLVPPRYMQMPMTLCQRVARQSGLQFHVPQTIPHMRRLCFQALIPDLSLIAVGCQTGRVALFTPTRMGNGVSKLGEVITMRLEEFLPLPEHEAKHRPHVPLLGLAVSPVWRKQKEKVLGAPREKAKAWRIFLHYMDHTILTYEVLRSDRDGLNVY